MKKLALIITMSLINTCESTPTQTDLLSSPVSLYFESIKDQPDKLRAFFWQMPKGGDIHHHALGSVKAEDYLDKALEQNLSIHPRSFQLYRNGLINQSQDTSQIVSIRELLSKSPDQREAIIDHWSMRNIDQYTVSHRDRFFSVFEKFEPAMIGNEAHFLSKICESAAQEHIQYIETMVGIPSIMSKAAALTQDKAWDPGISVKDHLKEWFDYLESKNIDQWADYNAEVMDHWMETTHKHGVHLKFQVVGLRIVPDQAVIFSHLLLAFKTAMISDHVVGVNFVAPEDNSVALENYSTHMAMFRFLKAKYPNVNLTLHAGELNPETGLINQEHTKFHIRQAVEIAGAQRIGHGFDVEYEDQSEDLLTHMRISNIAVEINLETNSVILSSDSASHPLKTYLEAGVPVCLSTDDAAILRSNFTNQFLMLVEYYPEVSYSEIKEIVLNSIRYSFMNETEKLEALERLNLTFKAFEKAVSNKSI